MRVEDIAARPEDGQGVIAVLDAIDHLLNAIERFEAPVARELLCAAMVALVQECGLQEPRRRPSRTAPLH